MTEPRLLQNFSGGRAIVVTDRASSLDVLIPPISLGASRALILRRFSQTGPSSLLTATSAMGPCFRSAQSAGCRRLLLSGSLA
jgi:hypothetical protein